MTNISSSRHRSKAARDRRARRRVRPQRVDELRRGIEHRHFGVAEAVDRLLAIADDEDRGRDGAVAAVPSPAAQARHQLADQAPLRAAGVLELVDQHVLVARLEPIAAARELLHLAEQRQRALEQVGEVEHAVLVERAAVLVLRDREQPAHAARQHQVDVALNASTAACTCGPRPDTMHLVALVSRRPSGIRALVCAGRLRGSPFCVST